VQQSSSHILRNADAHTRDVVALLEGAIVKAVGKRMRGGETGIGALARRRRHLVHSHDGEVRAEQHSPRLGAADIDAEDDVHGQAR
jgi:hypothetical protein